MKYTPPPWRFEVNLKSRQVQLCGGVPTFDKIVMDFVRWGMGGAAPRFNTEVRTHLNIMERVEKFAEAVPGREHHESWFRTIKHADAKLIEAAPALYESLRWCLRNMTSPSHGVADDFDAQVTKIEVMLGKLEAELG